MDEMNTSADPAQQAGGDGSEEGPEIVVCIERYKSGKLLVGLDNDGDEKPGMDDDSGLQQVQSVQDALKVARDLLTNPNVPGADDAFASGYQQANGPQMSTKGMP